MQVRTTNLHGIVDDVSNWLKGDPSLLDRQRDLEKMLAVQAGAYPASYVGLPSGQKAGTQMQNTSDLKVDLTIDPTRTDLPNVFNFTSPVIPDFLRAATSINTTTKVPSPGAVALSLQSQPWYKNKTTLMLIGGVAVMAAAVFVFTGNGSKSGARKR